MNQATFHSTFPIFFITKIFRYDKIKNPAFLSCSGINSTRNEDGGKEISFWNVAWFKKVGRHLCPFSVECWDVIHTNILSLIFCRVKANRILSHSHLGAGIFIPVLIRFPLVTLKATSSNYWVGKRLPLITFYYLLLP